MFTIRKSSLELTHKNFPGKTIQYFRHTDDNTIHVYMYASLITLTTVKPFPNDKFKLSQTERLCRQQS